MQYFSQTTN